MTKILLLSFVFLILTVLLFKVYRDLIISLHPDNRNKNNRRDNDETFLKIKYLQDAKWENKVTNLINIPMPALI